MHVLIRARERISSIEKTYGSFVFLTQKIRFFQIDFLSLENFKKAFFDLLIQQKMSGCFAKSLGINVDSIFTT